MDPSSPSPSAQLLSSFPSNHSSDDEVEARLKRRNKSTSRSQHVLRFGEELISIDTDHESEGSSRAESPPPSRAMDFQDDSHSEGRSATPTPIDPITVQSLATPSVHASTSTSSTTAVNFSGSAKAPFRFHQANTIPPTLGPGEDISMSDNTLRLPQTTSSGGLSKKRKAVLSTNMKEGAFKQVKIDDMFKSGRPMKLSIVPPSDKYPLDYIGRPIAVSP